MTSDLQTAFDEQKKSFNGALMSRDLSQRDLDEIATVTTLEEICLIGGDIESYAALAALPNLRKLAINHYSVSDLSSVGSLVQLKELSLSENEQYSDIQFVAPLVNLEILDLTDGQFTDLEPIKHLQNLRVLKLTNCDEVSDISPLAYLLRLEELDLNSTGVEDLTPLSKLQHLKALDVRGVDEIDDYSVLDELNLGDAFLRR